MSKDNVKKLFEKIQKDKEFQKKYLELMQAHGKDPENVLAERLAEFGKTSGFDFGRNDLTAARAELMDKKNDGNELSDKDLSSVAGGCDCGGSRKDRMFVVSVLTVAVGCGVLSIIAEDGKSGDCARTMSSDGSCGAL